MKATVEDMKMMIAELKPIDSAIVSLYLDDAAFKVGRDGFAEADENFALLHRYMAGDLLCQNNIIHDQVTQQATGKVSQSYREGMLAEGYRNNYHRMYFALKTELQGRVMLV